MIYLDTSCLVKLFRPEPLTEAVGHAIDTESAVVISILVELETWLQLRAAWLGGSFTRNQLQRLEAQLAALRNQPPFEFRTLPGTVFQTALRQHQQAGKVHCRSLDRLHLAAMEELGLAQLMTHDEAQAKAALAMGFTVVRPGHS